MSPDAMLASVQADLGSAYNLAERRQYYIWNGYLGSMLNVRDDKFAYEFTFPEFQHPLTYLGDKVATIFLVNGFVVWFRVYGGSFRLLAIPMAAGIFASPWAGYLTTYWKEGGIPKDQFIYPVMKKLPCHWAIDAGYVSEADLRGMLTLDWHIPDYLADGRQYLATDCHEANRISRDVIGYWDAASMCGPLAWRIIHDVDGFPYRIGSWYANASLFTGANPRWTGQPWASFDPETFTLTHIATPMPGYDFASRGNLYPGDIIYSFASLYYKPNDQHFDHIFLVAGIDGDGARLSITNMNRNYPYADCYISQVILYTPGDRVTGVINHEWNGFDFGQTGTTGFDIFRWDWITYHLDEQPVIYNARWGDTLETIAFDWKVSPESIASANGLTAESQLMPGQSIILPAP